MKKVLIGGFLSLIGSAWALTLIFVAADNLTSAWSTPPGRFLTTLSEMDLTVWFAGALTAVLLGIGIMAVEYFRKDR